MKTISGREIKPPIIRLNSDRKATNDILKLDAWLLREVKTELKNDRVALRMFSRMGPKLTPAERGYLNACLFGMANPIFTSATANDALEAEHRGEHARCEGETFSQSAGARKTRIPRMVGCGILCLLCVSAGVRQKKQSEILMDLAQPRYAARSGAKPAAVGKARLSPASIIPLPMPAPSRTITRAVVIRPGITNVSVSWTCSTNWITENATAGGTIVYDTSPYWPGRAFTNTYATLDVRACLTNCLRTGLADATGPVTNMAYAASNRVTLPISKPFQQFRAFVGPAKQ